MSYFKFTDLVDKDRSSFSLRLALFIQKFRPERLTYSNFMLQCVRPTELTLKSQSNGNV